MEIEKKIILEKFCKIEPPNLPDIYKMQDIANFGLDYKLYDYQQKALTNILNCLYLYFNNKDEFYKLYQRSGLDKEFEEELNITISDLSYKFFKDLYNIDRYIIPFKHFINRASFWMATGSGKTLVMIKLIEILFNLIRANEIPEKNILILAPKDDILNQIKKHIEIFNKSYKLNIKLESLKNFAKASHQRELLSPESLTVFYYRADNISDKENVSFRKDSDKQRIDYESVLNEGRWYVILDEAHKGIKDTSKRQQYYTALSRNGFLFNFSATFTELIDIIATVYNFNLKEFIKAGYGKRLKIMNSEYKSFNKRAEKEFNEKERQKIVLQSLITLTAVKKAKEKIDSIKSGFYHNPMLVTIANEVNTKDAELKIFFGELVKIAKGEFEIKEAKQDLIYDFNENIKYHFDNGEITEDFIDIINKITKEDILKYVFNTEKQGIIEYSTIAENPKEIAFTHKNSSEPFALIYISEADKFKADLLNDYIESKTPYTTSFFKDINDYKNPINILLGSRIFAEGWDSNRPNIINFINIGVNIEAQKFVLQAAGRGIRIEPVRNFRKRLKELGKNYKKYFEYAEYSQIINNDLQSPIESLFIFSTKKEVVKNIINELDKDNLGDTWKTIKGIEENKEAKERIFVYTVKDEERKPPEYKIHKKDYETCLNFIGEQPNIKDKIILFDNFYSKNIIKTLNKIRDRKNFDFKKNKLDCSLKRILSLINEHFNQPEKASVFEKFKPIEREIRHFEKIAVKNISEDVLKKLEENITKSLLTSDFSSIEELDDALDRGLLKGKEYREKLEALKGSKITGFDGYTHKVKINTNFLNEHYYKPILLAEKNYDELFRYIIKEDSEIEFIKKLEDYYNTNENNLKKCDWWYFSKLVENIDDINIPYYNSNEQKTYNFYPDFIFWLKKDAVYYIIFVDPKGIEHTGNPIDKIKGFEDFFKGDLKYKNCKVITKLWYFNEKNPPHDFEYGYQEYWTSDFEKIFRGA